MIRDERGQLMVVLLAVMVVVTMLGVAFVTLMNVRQRLAGRRYRTVAARYLAEAGVERTLWALETGKQSSELLPETFDLVTGGALRGRFTIEAIRTEPNGLLSIFSWGEFGGVRRGIKTTAKLSPRILTYALFGDRLVRFEGTASRTYLLPSSPSPGCVAGSHLGSNGELWFMTRGTTVNAFTGETLQLRDGALSDHALLGVQGTNLGDTVDRPIGKAVLAGGAVLTFGEDHRHATDPRWLWVHGVKLGMDVVSTQDAEPLPVVDRPVLKALAQSNASNAALNEAVGFWEWRPLLHKRDGLYTRQEFLHILAYLAKNPSKALRGPIYVTGPVAVPEGVTLRILDGFLAVEGSLTVQVTARLDVLHTPGSHAFPGVLTIGDAAPLVVQQRGVLVVDGLVYAERTFDAGEESVIDAKGAVVGGDPHLSIRNHNATFVVRYDPSVLSTVGIQPQPGSHKIIARVVAWEEMR